MNQDSKLIAAIDIGTTKIVALAGRQLPGKRIELLGIESVPSTGVKRGVVLNIDETTNAIMEVVGRLQMRLNMRITDIYVGIAGQHIKSISNRGYRFIDQSFEIKHNDVEGLYNDNFKIPVEAGEQILHVIPMDYIVDNESGIKNPIGMSGRKLEGSFHVVLGQHTSVKNIEKCVYRVGLLLNDLILEPLASARSVLTEEEKEAGVVVVDIGGGTTDIAIYHDNVIRHTAVIPFGGNSITSDIKEGCSVLLKHAESLKIQFGSAIAETERIDDVVAIPGMPGWEPREISLNLLANIIQARMEEIIDFVAYEIENTGYFDKLGAGIVLTGGGADLRNLPELIKLRTGLDVRIGVPDMYIKGEMFPEVYSPRYSTSFGLLLSAMDRPVKRPVEPKLFAEAEMESPNNDKNNQISDKNRQKTTIPSQKKEASKKRLELTGNLFDSIKGQLNKIFDDKVIDTEM